MAGTELNILVGGGDAQQDGGGGTFVLEFTGGVPRPSTWRCCSTASRGSASPAGGPRGGAPLPPRLRLSLSHRWPGDECTSQCSSGNAAIRSGCLRNQGSYCNHLVARGLEPIHPLARRQVPPPRFDWAADIGGAFGSDTRLPPPVVNQRIYARSVLAWALAVTVRLREVPE
jgi:hypothetical protein